MFETYGRCFYGILCRFGQNHIDPQTGENRIEPKGNYLESMNKFPPLLKHFLRRKKYNYKLADQLVKIANKEITKANVTKRKEQEEKEEKSDRSLVETYLSALPTITTTTPTTTNDDDEVKRKRMKFK